MIVLDSNHLRVLRIPGAASERLKDKLIADGRDVATTIITIEEGIKGHLAEIVKAHRMREKVPHYGYLQDLLDFCSEWVILPFDIVAVAKWEELKHNPRLRRKGTADLQIAAIAICNNALLLTKDQDFEGIPNLHVEDWLLDDPVEEQDW